MRRNVRRKFGLVKSSRGSVASRKIKSLSLRAGRKLAVRSFIPCCCKYHLAARLPSLPRRNYSGFAGTAKRAARCSTRFTDSD